MFQDEGGYVVPKQDCPHLIDHVVLKPSEVLRGIYVNKCQACEDSTESWLCLQCNHCYCSRYVRGHMGIHWQETKIIQEEGHCIAVSLSDLNVWCYLCEEYVKHDKLQQILVQLEILKFGSSTHADILNKPPPQFTTGFFYDKRMNLHKPESQRHYESPVRIEIPHETLIDKGILAKCHTLRPRQVTKEELLLVHSQSHINNVFQTANPEGCSIFTQDAYANQNTALAASLACGGVVDMTIKILKGDLKNGFALVRPPGHHCEQNKHGGFCLFNNVAVAVAVAREKFGQKRFLIVDWDVHHGNGIQQIFYSDPNVLYLSLHRYEHSPGFFYPDEGKADRVGEGLGEGMNINVPFPYVEHGYGDDDYITVFNELFLPVAYEFNPELVLVCAGFDAAKGDPMGEFQVSPECFAVMTSLLQQLADGKIILALEGGYHPEVVANCVEECMKVLLGNKIIYSMNLNPKPETKKCIQISKDIHAKYWKSLQ